MLATEFFQALCLPKRWSVCGIPVNALSCWHLYALEQIGNAYAFDGRGAGPDDAAGMLMICGMDYRRGSRLFTQPRKLARLTGRYHRRIARLDWADLHAACLDYAQTCKELPEAWVREGGRGRSLGGPHTWHVVQCLTSVMRYSVEEAWNEAYTTARCWYDVWRESKGEAELMSDRQRLLLLEAQQHAGVAK